MTKKIQLAIIAAFALALAVPCFAQSDAPYTEVLADANLTSIGLTAKRAATIKLTAFVKRETAEIPKEKPRKCDVTAIRPRIAHSRVGLF